MAENFLVNTHKRHPSLHQATRHQHARPVQVPPITVPHPGGFLAQIEGIAAAVVGTELLTLADCGHSPQRDQPNALISAAGKVIARQPGCRQLAQDS